jgi:acetoin utilization deacetylase AcuC-like enzyme
VEVLGRLEAIVTKLEKSKIVDFTSPQFLASDETEAMDRLRKFHLEQYVNFIKDASSQLNEFFPEYFIADACTPLSGGTYRAALTAIDCALSGARVLSTQTLVYALCRPPGHHAGRAVMSGYCYFNNAAIAADYLSTRGRVAILDIDYHHGNGTQVLLYDRADILCVSIHADPTEQFPYLAALKRPTLILQEGGYCVEDLGAIALSFCRGLLDS